MTAAPFRDPIIYPGEPVKRFAPLRRLCNYCQATYLRADRAQHLHHMKGECL
jgi:hypothetical protein